jgi:hypothetical protein
MAEVVIPDELRMALAEASAPNPEPLPIFSALAYAIFIAGSTQRPLILSGDRSVWCKEWGKLVDVH